MRKVFCDACGVEIPPGPLSLIAFALRPGEPPHYKEICSGCTEKVREVLGLPPEEDQPAGALTLQELNELMGQPAVQEGA